MKERMRASPIVKLMFLSEDIKNLDDSTAQHSSMCVSGISVLIPPNPPEGYLRLLARLGESAVVVFLRRDEGDERVYVSERYAKTSYCQLNEKSKE
jgi:hypothetical protein